MTLTLDSSSTASVPRSRSRHTLLVVDDEADVVKSVKDLLRLEYRVLGATSASEGLDILSREPVSVVMTDQRMPGMTGVQFLAKVKEHYPDIVRLLFTGYADVRAVIDAINQGNVWRYITKPWDPDELTLIIREACERYDLVRERRELTESLRVNNEQLVATNAELQRANDLKHAFIQVASHELRTPLTILQGMLRLATHVQDASPTVKTYLERMDRASKRLQYLVDQIVAMLVANKFERTIQRQHVDVTPLLRDAGEDVRPFVELRHQQLDIDVPADLGIFNLESVGIRDAVNHLLLNAVKFTPDGGTVRLGAEKDAAGDLLIRISDTGEGMDEQTTQRLFQPFFTGFDVSRHCSGTYEHGRRGLGLGLTIVKTLVDLHGGTIDVQSEVGKGTQFTIRIPKEPKA